ncbi:MAG: hypothetical protein HYT94_02695 [Parcubacteria group bacterium]|nr:hypothetical protein [Parcubacteria group bacterium]
MKLIVLFIIFSIALWYFNIDVRGFIDSHPQIKASLEASISFLIALWNNYLSVASSYIWNDIMIDIVWKNLAPFIEKLKG